MAQLTLSPATPLFINNLSYRFGCGATLAGCPGNLGTFASAVWPAANRALFYPLVLPFAYPVKRVFWLNGGTLTGSVDVGIYKASGARLYSTGGIAQSGASVRQFSTVDWLLQPGSYYLALGFNSGTATMFRATFSTALARLAGIVQQSSAYTLPTSMTPEVVATSYNPLFGLTKLASGF